MRNEKRCLRDVQIYRVTGVSGRGHGAPSFRLGLMGR